MFHLFSRLGKKDWRLWRIALGVSLFSLLLGSFAFVFATHWTEGLQSAFRESDPGNRIVVQCPPQATTTATSPAGQPNPRNPVPDSSSTELGTLVILSVSLLASLIVVTLRPYLAVPILMVGAALNHYRFEFFGVGIRPEHIALVAAAFVLVRLMLARRIAFDVTFPDLIFGVFLLLASVSSIVNAPYPLQSFKFIGLMLVAFVTFWLTRSLINSASDFKRALAIWLIIGAIEAAFGILAWLIFPLGINLGGQLYPYFVSTDQGQSRAFSISPYGTLLEPGIFGSYVMPLAFVFATLAISPELASRRRWFWVGLILSMLALLLSFARGAWLGFLAGGALWLLTVGAARSRPLLNRMSVAIGVGLVGFLITVIVLNAGSISASPLTVAASRLLSSESVNCRLDAYGRALADWSQNPWFGNGVNVFAQKYYVSNQYSGDWISSLGLMTLHDTGVIGLGVLLLWVGAVGRTVVRAIRTASSGFVRTALLGLSVGFIALLVAYQVTTAFWLGFTWVQLGLMCAGTLILQRQNPS